MAEQRKISLVLSDVDGTLVTEEKVLTEDARAAVRRLLDAGIRFAVTSGRPPLGMAMLLDALHLDTPIAGFNGGLFVTPDLAILEQKTLPEDVAAKSIELIRTHGLDAWVYRGNDWLISRADAPHVAREAWTVKFEPKVVADCPKSWTKSPRSSASAMTTTWSRVARRPSRRDSDRRCLLRGRSRTTSM